MKELEFTNSPYVNKKYEEFLEKNGYVPEMFNPYNCSEIDDYSPTITTQSGGITSSGSILIIEEIKGEKKWVIWSAEKH